MDNWMGRSIEAQGKITDGIIIVFPFVHVSITFVGSNFLLIDATWWYRNRDCHFMRRVEIDVLNFDVATDIIVEEFIMNISKQMTKIEKEDFDRYRDRKDVEFLYKKEESSDV